VSSRSRGVVAGCALALVLAASACGGAHSATPVAPQSPSVPSSGGPSVNLAPVIEGIALSSERVEVDNEITLSASVKDDETPVEQLSLAWKADAGSISGDGASVKWRAPKDIATPADYTVTLTVTERYGVPDASGVRPQNVTTATSPVIRVHNSPKELGDMSLLFLSDFAKSTVPSSTCLQNFSDSCRGKADERGDIDTNRKYYLILSSSLDLRSVSIGSNKTNANMTVACAFTSRIVNCSNSDPSSPACSKVGSTESVKGDCVLTGVYEQKRWWLCDSRFLSKGLIPAAMRGFFGSR
jgi:hypothetical protein